eukprot:TRINITY_DN95434_c0_g1_i1.p1 TRINITY_DN95434_c0_g1~~TRINITY_DN95434_c0_g1_i1.p1  ORF type:complete len:279 (-),score=51.43 TRINITY_DN95434_c0_g1_i1:12-848(-)
MANLYDILGVRRNSTKEELRRAYHTKALELHPDKNPEGESLFKEVRDAYEVLKDDEARRKYDTEQQRLEFFARLANCNQHSGWQSWGSSSTQPVPSYSDPFGMGVGRQGSNVSAGSNVSPSTTPIPFARPQQPQRTQPESRPPSAPRPPRSYFKSQFAARQAQAFHSTEQEPDTDAPLHPQQWQHATAVFTSTARERDERRQFMHEIALQDARMMREDAEKREAVLLREAEECDRIIRETKKRRQRIDRDLLLVRREIAHHRSALGESTFDSAVVLDV